MAQKQDHWSPKKGLQQLRTLKEARKRAAGATKPVCRDWNVPAGTRDMHHSVGHMNGFVRPGGGLSGQVGLWLRYTWYKYMQGSGDKKGYRGLKNRALGTMTVPLGPSLVNLGPKTDH